MTFSFRLGALLTNRSQAICCGLLARLSKYMQAAHTLVTHMEASADIMMAINRCMLESAVNVTYLLSLDTDEVYENFVRKGLGPEREFHDLVQANIAERGGIMTPIEDRILASIVRVIAWPESSESPPSAHVGGKGTTQGAEASTMSAFIPSSASRRW